MERGKKYAEAIAAYEAIPKETEFYEEALSRIGVCELPSNIRRREKL